MVAHVLHPRGGQAEDGERVSYRTIAGADGWVGVQQRLPPRHDAVPRRAGRVEAVGQGQRCLAGAQQRGILSRARQFVEHVDGPGLARRPGIRAPLQHQLLKGLRHKAIPHVAAGNGVAHRLRSAQALELAPKACLPIVRDAEAPLPVGRLGEEAAPWDGPLGCARRGGRRHGGRSGRGGRQDGRHSRRPFEQHLGPCPLHQ